MYGTENWFKLVEQSKVEETYHNLPFLSREYNQLMATKIKLKAQLSNLIERTFSGLEKIFKTNDFNLLLAFYE